MQGHTNDWGHCYRVIVSIENEARLREALLLIDIGAGTQSDCLGQLLEYLALRPQSVLLICAPPSDVLDRNRSKRSLQEYEDKGYRSRIQLYGIAQHRVDVAGRSKDDAKAYFVQYLGETFGVPVRRF